MCQNTFTADRLLSDYWPYYRDIEEQVFQIRRYISFSRKNFSAYSIEILKLLQLVCSEVDVFAKQIAVSEEPTTKIDDYRTILMWGPLVYNAIPEICDVRLALCNSDCTLHPWKNWRFEGCEEKGKGKRKYKYKEECGSPFWWNDYNKVKHQRAFADDAGVRYYEKANLKTLLNALGALFVLENLYYDRLDGSNGLDSIMFFPALE